MNTKISFKFTVNQIDISLEENTKILLHFCLVADVPGIVPGSIKDATGLGSGFLRHIERCLALLLVIDMSVEQPWKQYELLMKELVEYKIDLTKKPLTVIGNKIDDPDGKAQIDETRRRIQHPFLPISTVEKINIDKLLIYLRKLYDELIVDQPVDGAVRRLTE